ncbi:MAG: O-antigen ligase family protein [Pseudorhodobacter sp.]
MTATIDARTMTSGRSANAPEQATSGKLPAVALIYLFCVVLPLGFNLGPLYMTTLRLLLMALVIPLFFSLLTGRYGRLYITDFLFVLHVIWMALALAATTPNQLVTQIGSVGVEFLGGYLVGRACIRSRSAFISLCKWLVILVFCLLPFSILETISGQPTIVEALRRIPGVVTVPIVTIEGRMGLERVQSSFAHPIHYGLFCSVAFSLCFVALKDVYSDTRRYVCSAIVLISGCLALSSGALLAMVLQIGMIAWSLIFARLQSRWWLLVGLFALAYVVVDLLSNRTPLRVFMSYATFSAHNAYWRGIIFEWGVMNIFGSAQYDIPAAPWFGLGMGDWIRPWYMRSGSMDNFWLVIAVRYGLPAFLILAMGYVVIIYKVMRRSFDDDPEMLRIRRAWVFTFLGLTFTLTTVHVWTNIYSFVFFMFGAGVWIITERPRKQANMADQPEPTEGKKTRTPSPGPYSRFAATHRRRNTTVK